MQFYSFFCLGNDFESRTLVLPRKALKIFSNFTVFVTEHFFMFVVWVKVEFFSILPSMAIRWLSRRRFYLPGTTCRLGAQQGCRSVQRRCGNVHGLSVFWPFSHPCCAPTATCSRRRPQTFPRIASHRTYLADVFLANTRWMASALKSSLKYEAIPTATWL